MSSSCSARTARSSRSVTRSSIAPGETVATFVRLGTKVPWFPGFFGNAASAVASTAASQGITAIAPVQLPLTNNK